MNKIGVEKSDCFFIIFIVALVFIFFSFSIYYILFDSSLIENNSTYNSKKEIFDIGISGKNININNFEFDTYLIDLTSKKAEFINQKNIINFHYAHCDIRIQNLLLGYFNSSFFSVDIQNRIIFSLQEIVGSFSNFNFYGKDFSYYVDRKEFLVSGGFSLNGKNQELKSAKVCVLVKEKKMFLSGGVYSEFRL